MVFNSEQFYWLNRMPQRCSLLRAASRDYEVHFTVIESFLDRPRLFFNHLVHKVLSEKQQDLIGQSNRIRMALIIPTLNYPIHVSFFDSRQFQRRYFAHWRCSSSRMKLWISAKYRWMRWVCLRLRWVEKAWRHREQSSIWHQIVYETDKVNHPNEKFKIDYLIKTSAVDVKIQQRAEEFVPQ